MIYCFIIISIQPLSYFG